MPRLPIALQLYTVRDDCAKDFAGTLAKVSEIGYRGVELAGYNGMSIRELKSTLDDIGLQIAGNHLMIDTLLNNTIGKTIDENLSLGCTNIVLPLLATEYMDNAEALMKTGEMLNEIGETLRSSGITLAYHNHNWEFNKFEGEYGLDLLYKYTDMMFLKAEIDTYWVMKAGEDPVAYMKKYAGRVPLLHIKDCDPDDGSTVELGTGTLPLNEIIAMANEIGTRWLIVEQDTCKRPPLESVKISFDCLKERGYA